VTVERVTTVSELAAENARLKDRLAVACEIIRARAECDRDLLAALKALIAATEASDNPSDMGVSSDEDVMVAARAAVAKAEDQ